MAPDAQGGRTMSLTREQAKALIHEHALGFLDLYELAMAFAERVGGTIKMSGPRVVLHIKRPPRLKRVKP